MSDSTLFSYDRFLSLVGSDLVTYVEPYVTTRAKEVPEYIYNDLQSTLAELDEEHTVYALEIGMLLKPNEFANHVIGFLSSANASICCAAYNSINSLPTTLALPPDLVAKIAATPIVDLFASDVRSGDRVHVGTNEEFIRSLVARFA